MIVGITGGTGCGKSSACEFFKSKGYLVIDSDAVSRDVCSKGTPCLAELTKEFGVGILDADGSLKRRELGRIVFSDEQKLKRLNSITHKYIIKEIMTIIEQNKDKDIALDAPLLIETGLDAVCDKNICILADVQTREDRISLRDSLTPTEAKKRILSQKDDEFYISHCDHTFYNNGNIEALFCELSGIFGGINGR